MSETDIPRKVTATSVEARVGTTAYPPEYCGICDGRIKRQLGDAFGLDQYGVNLTVLEPGAASAQRHWHSKEDEFVYILSGSITLVDDDGEVVLETGDCAGFPAGRENGHMLINKSEATASYLEIGSRLDVDTVNYPTIDLHGEKTGGKYIFTRKDGSATD